MPLPLQGADVTRLLVERYGIRARPTFQLGDEVLPVSIVGDDAPAVEPPRIRSATAFFNQAAVAGEFGTCRIETPPSVLCVIRKIYWFINSATPSVRAFWGSSLTTPANTADKSFRDGRLLARGQLPAGVLTFGTDANALATVHWQVALPATAAEPYVTTFDPGLVVGTALPTPDFGFVEFQSTQANAVFRATVEWDEYELTL